MGDAFQELTGVSLTGAGAIMAVGAGLKVAYSEAIDAERAMTATNAVIKSTGGAAGLTADEIANLANQEKDLTGIDDAVIQGGENMLLTFRNIGGDTFPRATRAMMDMAAAMAGGNMDALDFKSTAIQLGKALNDPLTGISALQRVGVTFNSSQKATIKAMMEMNDVAGAQGIILAELESEFGGMAEAMGSTNEGKIRKAKQALSDMAEAVGMKLIPVLGDAATAFKLLVTAGDQIKTAQEEHTKAVLETSSSYEEYIAEIARMRGITLERINDEGRLLQVYQGAGRVAAEKIALSKEEYEVNRRIAASMKDASQSVDGHTLAQSRMGKEIKLTTEQMDALDKVAQAYNADVIGQMDKMPKMAELQSDYKAKMSETRDEIAKLEAENAKLAKSNGVVIPLSMKQLEEAYISLGKAMDNEKKGMAGASDEVQKWDRVIKGAGPKQYIDNSKAIADNTAKIIELKSAEAERAAEHEKMTKQVLLDTMKERFAIKGWAEDEVAAYTTVAVGMGLMTKEQATQAATQASLNSMYDEGKLSAEQYASAMLKTYQQSTKTADGAQEVDVKTEGATGSMNVLSRRTMPDSWSKFEITAEKAWALAGALAAVQAGSDINITVRGNIPTNPGGGEPPPGQEPPPGACFVGNTMVDIPNGRRRIDSLRVGNVVTVYDIESRQFVESPIAEIHTGRRSDMVCVITAQAGATCSPNHPWMTDSRGFIRADSLTTDDKIKTRRGYTQVLEITPVEGEYDVFDLTVEHNAHTYCVNGHVVHNKEFASGADFIVPPGFSNDTYPMRVSSGEHVIVTPVSQSGNGQGTTIGPINVYAAPGQNAKQIADAVIVELAAKTRAYRHSGIGALSP